MPCFQGAQNRHLELMSRIGKCSEFVLYHGSQFIKRYHHGRGENNHTCNIDPLKTTLSPL